MAVGRLPDSMKSPIFAGLTTGPFLAPVFWRPGIFVVISIKGVATAASSFMPDGNDNPLWLDFIKAVSETREGNAHARQDTTIGRSGEITAAGGQPLPQPQTLSELDARISAHLDKSIPSPQGATFQDARRAFRTFRVHTMLTIDEEDIADCTVIKDEELFQSANRLKPLNKSSYADRQKIERELSILSRIGNSRETLNNPFHIQEKIRSASNRRSAALKAEREELDKASRPDRVLPDVPQGRGYSDAQRMAGLQFLAGHDGGGVPAVRRSEGDRPPPDRNYTAARDDELRVQKVLYRIDGERPRFQYAFTDGRMAALDRALQEYAAAAAAVHPPRDLPGVEDLAQRSDARFLAERHGGLREDARSPGGEIERLIGRIDEDLDASLPRSQAYDGLRKALISRVPREALERMRQKGQGNRDPAGGPGPKPQTLEVDLGPRLDDMNTAAFAGLSAAQKTSIGFNRENGLFAWKVEREVLYAPHKQLVELELDLAKHDPAKRGAAAGKTKFIEKADKAIAALESPHFDIHNNFEDAFLDPNYTDRFMGPEDAVALARMLRERGAIGRDPKDEPVLAAAAGEIIEEARALGAGDGRGVMEIVEEINSARGYWLAPERYDAAPQAAPGLKGHALGDQAGMAEGERQARTRLAERLAFLDVAWRVPEREFAGLVEERRLGVRDARLWGAAQGGAERAGGAMRAQEPGAGAIRSLKRVREESEGRAAAGQGSGATVSAVGAPMVPYDRPVKRRRFASVAGVAGAEDIAFDRDGDVIMKDAPPVGRAQSSSDGGGGLKRKRAAPPARPRVSQQPAKLASEIVVLGSDSEDEPAAKRVRGAATPRTEGGRASDHPARPASERSRALANRPHDRARGGGRA